MKKIVHFTFGILPILVGILFFSFSENREINNKETFWKEYLYDNTFQANIRLLSTYNYETRPVIRVTWEPIAKNQEVSRYVVERSVWGSEYNEISYVNPAQKEDLMSKNVEIKNPYNTIIYTTEGFPQYFFNERVADSLDYLDIKYRIVAEMKDGQMLYSQEQFFKVQKPKNSNNSQRISAACPAQESVPKGYTQDASTVKSTACVCGVYNTADYLPACIDETGGIAGCTYDCKAACDCRYDPCCEHNCSSYAICGCPTWKSCMKSYAPVNYIYSVTNYTPITLSAKASGCYNTCTGAIDLTVSGGSKGSTPTYSWSNGSKSQDISALCSSSYTVNVIDQYNCPATITVAVPMCLNVQISKFEVLKNGKYFDIVWETDKEEKNEYFVIERSHDGNTYSQLHKEKGKGTYSRKSIYKHTDTEPLMGTSYYRLKQIDFDGTETYSGFASVYMDITEEFTVVPNPVKDVLTIKLFAKEEDIKLDIVDAKGNMVKNYFYKKQTGLYKYQFNLEELPPGTYFVVLTNKEGIYRRKVIKQ